MNGAVTATVPISVVGTDSVGPVTVVTKELRVVAEVITEVRVPVSKKRLLAPGEQPTKFGADSLTAVQDAMLNAMAPALT